MKKFPLIVKDFPHFLHGGDYSPEQWKATPEIWDADMRLMREANCNEMTMGIFSWAELETDDGEFDFSWLDRMMDEVYKNGGRVVLATPSASLPQWLAEKHPEVLRTLEDGRRVEYFGRQKHCYTSRIYRERVRLINEKLAERYADHPALALWHISNEYHGTCFCENCVAAFRDWLKKKYGSIERLNAAWWNGFWGHRKNSFDMINPPRDVWGENSSSGLKLDWKRFTSESIIDFAREEIAAIRKYSSKPITTNCMGTYSGFDHKRMAAMMDVHSNDFYPDWSSSDDAMLYISFNSAFCRGLKGGRPFMVMESAPGAAMGYMDFERIKSSEEQLLEAMALVGCGADTVQYFQWRKGRGAVERFHGAVVDHYGRSDTRVFSAVKRTGEVLSRLDGVLGTGIRSEVALLHDYDTRWSFSDDAGDFWNDPQGYIGMMKDEFHALLSENVSADIVGFGDDLSKYKLLILTLPYMMSEEKAARISDFVRRGGILITTPLTAVSDEDMLCCLGGVPGFGLTEVFGLRVEEVDRPCSDRDGSQNSVIYGGNEYPVCGISEVTADLGAAVLGEYTGRYYKGSGAVFANGCGEGRAYYVAFTPDRDFWRAFLSDMIREHEISRTSDIGCDDGVMITHREGDGEHYFFVLNRTREEKRVSLDREYTELVERRRVSGEAILPPLGVMILN